MDFESYFKQILNDVKVDLTDEFDRNFERKAFFDKAWPQTKWPVSKGSLLLRTGAGRRSISSKIEGSNIVWRSSLQYMAIHNEGGEIVVTAKMIKFFWAMYYKSVGAVSKGNNQRNVRLNNEAMIWKSLALMKSGAKIKIPQRRFIGDHPKVDESIKRVWDDTLKGLDDDLYNQFKSQIQNL
ncbi:MAG: hypothetical protein IPL97_01555 [Niastella sp.]|nr:hypothetical protein [Niastella sp.]